jgi:serine/threonine protein kinase
LRQGKQYFSAKVEDRSFQPTDLNTASLDITPIPSEHFCPKIEHNITEVLNVRPNTYIKRPSLIYWGLSDTNPTWHGEIVLQEAEVCEVLKRNPHPNIAQYYGCLVEAERIIGLCFVKYNSTISKRLIGSSLAEREAYMEGIECGVFHLHQLGLIHNDLNPNNILMDGDVPFIIDFDSCRRKGEKLGYKAGTFGWALTGAEFAEPENDLYSLAKIRDFLWIRGE